METITSGDKLSHWREEGRRLIQQNFCVFRDLVARAKDYSQQDRYDAASVYGEVAAIHALLKHSGLFVSSELEQILLTIGKEAIKNNLPSYPRTSISSLPKKVLHVSTNVSSFSGIPRLIRRWIQQDTERSYSLALTTQFPDKIPKALEDEVNNSGGKIYILNENNNSVVFRANQLQKIAAEMDLAILHAWEHDVIPTIAFANKEKCPPIIYVNHGDHWFWLGASISDVVANLRESGMRLSQKRRGIAPDRNMLLPTILEPARRELSRIEAKQQLGIDESSILLLSIARAPKYKTIDGTSFADVHLPLLKQYKEAILVVIGPGNSEDWSSAIEQTGERIKVLGQTESTAVFYQAADIYIDSFPFVSITSLLEAGSYELPLVSRYPYSDECEIFGADMPGLTGNLIRTRNLKEYYAALSRLIEDKNFRLSLGKATRQKIIELHTGSNWLNSLEKVYLKAASLAKSNEISAWCDTMSVDEPDCFLPKIYGVEGNLDWVIPSRLKFMPLRDRLPIWIQIVKKQGFNLRHIGFLFPRIYNSLSSFLKKT
ncbi:MAG: glycosyltransferase [Hydrococcus sp. Prado102]|jgi:glycosyltransferase involved in cell wall biosynthesis|nr:glycosyltransferase [Hydrococcus sp. Prado102]